MNFPCRLRAHHDAVAWLLAALWGFLGCFSPAKFRRLVSFLSFGADWSALSSPPKFLAKTANGLNRAAGFIIFLAGLWFVFMAALIYADIASRAR